MQGAHCPSCAFTIEKLDARSRRTEVRVDVTGHEIRVDYDGTPETLERIAGIVARLGYRPRFGRVEPRSNRSPGFRGLQPDRDRQ